MRIYVNCYPDTLLLFLILQLDWSRRSTMCGQGIGLSFRRAFATREDLFNDTPSHGHCENGHNMLRKVKALSPLWRSIAVLHSTADDLPKMGRMVPYDIRGGKKKTGKVVTENPRYRSVDNRAFDTILPTIQTFSTQIRYRTYYPSHLDAILLPMPP
jgi:hypothetical protein